VVPAGRRCLSLAERLRAALEEGARRDPPLLAGDDVTELMAAEDRLRPAAVLIAVTDRAEPGVLLTRRSDTLRSHAGQVAFPGGRVDPDDADGIAAALREADEEIGLPPGAVEVVGTVGLFRTVTGFEITPVVGVVPPDLPLRPHDAEVAALFEVPLAYLIDPANHIRQTAEWRGAMRTFYEIPWTGQRIWGATAAMIVNFARRLGWS
jgi:8-oxo-dGTP pyrophosphatase MutT (NUDIX family)